MRFTYLSGGAFVHRAAESLWHIGPLATSAWPALALGGKGVQAAATVTIV